MKRKKISLLLSVLTAMTAADTAVILNMPQNNVIAMAEETTANQDKKAEAVKGTVNDITYTLENEAITITGYNGLNPDLDIPSEINVNGQNYKVTAIGASAFANRNSLERIRIPETVTSIGNNAFDNCYNMLSITMPDSVKTIGACAFRNCKKIQGLKVPNTLKSIESNAFNGCIALNSINLPKSLTEIKDYAFANCTSLSTMKIPSNTVNIGQYAFTKDTALKTIDIDDSIKNIGVHAFEGCTALTSVKLPSELQSIEDYTFNGCTALTSVETPNKINKIGGFAFYNCTSLKGIRIPASVRSIGEQSFYKCTSLKDLVMEEGTKTLGNYCFSCCYSLEDLKMCNTIDTVGDHTFESDTGLKTVKLSDNLTAISAWMFNGCNKLTSVIVPNKVYSLGNYCFYGNSVLTYLEIPSSVTYIGYQSFYGDPIYNCVFKNRSSIGSLCDNSWLPVSYWITLTSNSYTELQSTYGDQKLILNRDNCYYNIYNNSGFVNPLTTRLSGTYTLVRKTVSPEDYTIESRVDSETGAAKLFLKPTAQGSTISLDDNAYSTEIDITANPKAERTIYIKDKNGEIAKGKENLTSSLYVKADLDTISSFVDFTLTKIAPLDSKVTVSINGGAEEEVTGDKYTALQNGEYKFKIINVAGNAYTKTVNVNNIIKDKEFNFSINSDGTATITKYTGNDIYVKLPKKVTIDNKEYTVSAISMNAFKGNTTLKKVEIPDNIKVIKNYAFKGCTSLEEVVGLNNVSNIDNYAFNGCSSLKNIDLSNNTKKIGNLAFAYCDGIKALDIPESVESIGNGAFLSCNSLKTLIMLNDKVKIGSMAFRGCNTLTNIVLKNFASLDALKNKGINLDDYYKVTLECDGYTEIQLVRKGGYKLISEDCESYYNLYDGETLVTDLTINSDKTLKIVKKTAGDADYTINGTKGDANWYNNNVTIKASSADSTISCDGINFAAYLNISQSLSADKAIYIKDKDGIISKAIINKNTIKIDKDAPIFDVSADLKTESDKITFTINSDAGNSGVYKTTVSRDGGEEIEVKENTFTTNCKGKYKFTVISGSGIKTIKYVNVSNIQLAINVLDYDYDLNEEEGTAKIKGYNGSEAVIQIPEDFIKDGKKYKVTGIESSAFCDNNVVKKVVIPKGISEISDSIFIGCSNLESVIIDSEVSTINASMFENCTSLKEVKLPASVTTISESAFSGCTSLSEIDLPASVKEISSMALNDCTSLESIIIPKGTSVDEDVFSGCKNLKSIVIYGENTDAIANSGIDLNEFNAVTSSDESGNKITTLTKKISEVENTETNTDSGKKDEEDKTNTEKGSEDENKIA